MKTSSKVLWIDTATDHLFLALVIDGDVVGLKSEEGKQNHSVRIVPLIQELLSKHQISLKDVSEVVVGIGPGSYTGVRIGVSIAKMIGYLNSIPVKEISTLALIASSCEETNVVACVDARRNRGFLGHYRNQDEKLVLIGNESVDDIDAFTSMIPKPYSLVSSGIPNLKKLIHSDLFRETPNVHEIVPNYLQVTEAERKRHEQ